MFGLSFHTSTLILIVFEILLLSFQVISYAARYQDKSRLRFLILIIAFLQFNILNGLMPNDELAFNYLAQNIIVYISAIALASYYFYYLINELELSQLKLYNVKVLVISLISSFVLLFFGTYFITGDFILARKVYIIIPILISFYFCFQTIDFLLKKWRALKNKKTPYGSIILAGNVGIIFMASMPITDYFDKTRDQAFSIFLINICLIATFFAYIKNYLYQSKLEYEFLKNIGYEKAIDSEEKNRIKSMFKDYRLTARELDIAMLMLEGKSYKEIANHMFLVPKTISKHASNIFKKTNCAKKTEFLERFTNLTDESV